MELLCLSLLVIDPYLVVGVFIILEERGFMPGCVFTGIRLVIIIGVIVCGGAGLEVGLTWDVLAMVIIKNHTDGVLGNFYLELVNFPS